MRYIKVFLFVFLFFIVMMLFVQNQASFSDNVTLKFDPMVMPVLSSTPIPRYALLLICFALDAGLVLAMLIWDKLSLSGRLASTKHQASSLQKQLEKANDRLEKANARIEELEAELEKVKEEKSV